MSQRHEGNETARPILQALGASLLFLAVLLATALVTHDVWMKELVTLVLAIGFQSFALWKGWRVQLPVRGLPLPRVLLWSAPCLVLAFNWLPQIPTSPPEVTWLPVLMFYLMVGIGEELFFRGFLFDLMRDVRPPLTLLVTSLIFGLFHFENGLNNVVSASVVGLGFGLARQAGMPLVLLILLHWLINVPNHLPHDPPSQTLVVHAWLVTVHTNTKGLLMLVALAYTVVIAFIFTVRYRRACLGKAERQTDRVQEAHSMPVTPPMPDETKAMTLTKPVLTLERKYAAVLFDMDGTLVDSRVVVERVWREWAATHGVDGAQVVAASHGRRTVDTVRQFAPSGMDAEAEARRLEATEVADDAGIVAIPGAAQLLARLAANRWAVVTSASRELATRRLSAAGLPIPAVMVTSEDVAQGKPDPEGYQTAARQLGTTADQCLVFEDAAAGIEAGLRAGSDVIVITAASPHLFETDCPVVEDFTQIHFELA